MKETRSGDYKLPSALKCFVGNLLISVAKCMPQTLCRQFLRRHSYYQVFNEAELGDQQGLSINKWKAMQMPSDLSGKSVLDIGCADGFFCQLSARMGASRVLGVDSAPGRLLRARLSAIEEGLNIRYRMDIFPSRRLRDKFDYVLCLSVLHHSLLRKDFWRVLTQDECRDDLATLRENLKSLRALTSHGGKCLIELPYEYDDPAERHEVNFDRFNKELIGARFLNATCLGPWEHNEKYRAKKDRMVYLATA